MRKAGAPKKHDSSTSGAAQSVLDRISMDYMEAALGVAALGVAAPGNINSAGISSARAGISNISAGINNARAATDRSER